HSFSNVKNASASFDSRVIKSPPPAAFHITNRSTNSALRGVTSDFGHSSDHTRPRAHTSRVGPLASSGIHPHRRDLSSACRLHCSHVHPACPPRRKWNAIVSFFFRLRSVTIPP